jgi:hypothetical protein
MAIPTTVLIERTMVCFHRRHLNGILDLDSSVEIRPDSTSDQYGIPECWERKLLLAVQGDTSSCVACSSLQDDPVSQEM